MRANAVCTIRKLLVSSAALLERNGHAEVGMYTSTSDGYCGTGGSTPMIWCGRSFI
jgi:hypothetical protein